MQPITREITPHKTLPCGWGRLLLMYVLISQHKVNNKQKNKQELSNTVVDVENLAAASERRAKDLEVKIVQLVTLVKEEKQVFSAVCNVLVYKHSYPNRNYKKYKRRLKLWRPKPHKHSKRYVSINLCTNTISKLLHYLTIILLLCPRSHILTLCSAHAVSGVDKAAEATEPKITTWCTK